MRAFVLLLLAACSGGDTYILEGTVLERPSQTRIVVAHEPIAGFMDAMTMPFEVESADVLDGVVPGDRIYARLVVEETGSHLERVRVIGKGHVPAAAVGPAPLAPGEQLPALAVPVHDGTIWTIGAGQGRPTAIGFVYTRCPLPEYCPAVVARMQALQVATEGRILLVTLDPDHDTIEVLATFAASAGAQPETWAFGRVEHEALETLAMRAGLPVTRDGDQILHALRLLVLDAEGRLVARHDDGDWKLETVADQLRY